MTTKTYDETTFLTAAQIFAGGGSVTEKAGAFIYVSGFNGLTLSDAPWKVKIDGTVQSTNLHGIFLAGDAGASKAVNSTVTVGADGTVWGAGANTVGILALQATDVVNSGMIHGGDFGIHEIPTTPSSSKAVSITNNAEGVIIGNTGGIYFDDANHDLVVKNAGTMNEIALNGAHFGIQFRHSLQLTNTGDIFGTVTSLDPSLTFGSKVTNSGSIGDILDPFSDAIELADGNDTVTNGATGVITGFVNMRGGNNTVTNAGHILFGVTFGDGDDKMTNTGPAAGAIAMGNGNNTFTNSGELSSLTTGSGNDVAANTKSILQAIDLGEGNNKLTNSGTIGQGVTFGDGDDTATNSKSIAGAVDFGDGKNAFTNSGTLASTLTFGTGDDIVKNTGSIAGAVDFGEGTNNVTNGGIFSSTLAFGAGDDVFKNTGTIVGTINFDNGNNTFTNSGDLGATVIFGSGNDVMTNSAELDGAVVMGEGNNTFTNTGVLNGGVTFGTGNDYFKTTYAVGSTVIMGDGNDTFIGGSGRDIINDGNGDDSYSFGAGDDDFTYVASGTDIIDGGAGNDLFRMSTSVAVGLFINLDSKAYTFNTFTVAGGSINTLTGAEVGKIKGFETVNGTLNADWLHGSSAAEALNGSSGADIYIGGGGADILQNSGDNAVDTFIYENIKDSGATKATRDTITGFEGAGVAGGDVIDLSAIDTNTKLAGHQGFAWLDNNVAFHGTGVAELRTITEGADTIIQGDVNGDGKADFTIDVTGINAFSKEDFNL